MLDEPPNPGPVDPAAATRCPRPACLVLHGLGGGAYELGPVIAGLESEGLRISAPVLPGHEGHGPIMPASCWHDWAATVEAAYDALTAQEGPIAVVGFSTGVTLALYLAARRPVARMVPMAPSLAIRFSHLIPPGPAPYLRQLPRVIPHLPRRPPCATAR